jgi:hypothetical protein
MKYFDELLEYLDEEDDEQLDDHHVHLYNEIRKNSKEGHGLLRKLMDTDEIKRANRLHKLGYISKATTDDKQKSIQYVHHGWEKELNEEFLIERKLIRRIRKGKMSRKLVCGKGMKNVGNTKCVRMSGQERLHRRMAVRKTVRTKRARRGKLRRSNFQRQRSMLRRKSMGLH